jgi:Sulfotransferase domain
MPRIRRRRVDRSSQNQNHGGGTYSFAQFLVIVFGLFVIIFNLKSVIEHERGELQIRTATVQSKGDTVDQSLIDQIVETAAQRVASKATSHIEQHLTAFVSLNQNKARVDEVDTTEANLEDEESFDRTTQQDYGQRNNSEDESPDGIESNQWPASKPRIPNVLVAGVQRGATASLTKYLVDQFDACSYRSDRLFFSQEQVNATMYARLYSNCTSQSIFVDGSSDTILYPNEVKKIYDEDGSIDDLKVIVTLREPVERELSSYSYRRSQLNESFGGTDLIKKDGTVRSFMEDVKDRLLQDFKQQNEKALYGTYADQLKQWFEILDRKQILVLSFAELQANETDYLDRVHSFLSQKPRQASQVFPVEAKAEYQHERTENLCKFMNFMNARFFRSRNMKLEELLKDNPGPTMEQTPFPPFQLQCTPESQNIIG